MKNKIKKWHIALMSFMLLFVAVFASMFSLRADTIDEETGETITDNWELGVVFYDSTVNNGKTALTEIDWNASNGGYSEGTPRVITIQINYKNNSTVTTYQPGELEIRIPNLIYSVSSRTGTAYDANWKTSVVVGANDATHTNYDWDFSNGSSPTEKQSFYAFTNTHVIEEKSNLEGSIQIVYTITPSSETPESFLNECIHNYTQTLQAQLKPTSDNISCEMPSDSIEKTIKSFGWDSGSYINKMTEDQYCWEYTSPTLENLEIVFDPTSKTELDWDFVYIYDQTGECIYKLSGDNFANEIYRINGNYVKLTMSSDSNTIYKGFLANIGSNAIKTVPNSIIYSNEINFNYTRTYIHPWKHNTYKLNKTASKITSLDGLPEGEYFWVKYNFRITGDSSTYYPYIKLTSNQIRDSFPEDCIVYDANMTEMTPAEENMYHIQAVTSWAYNDGYTSTHIYVGYPKSIYNEETKNLSITNHADLYVQYADSDEFVYQDESEVALNLANFEFVYSGELYGINKKFQYYTYDNSKKIYYESLIGEDLMIGNKGKGYAQLTVTAIYTGKAMDVKFGDDLLYVTGNNGNYRKLLDNEYYFSEIIFPPTLKNGNGITVPAEKYDCELWVRYANSNEYVKYQDFKNSRKIWTFTKEDKIVGYYFIINNVTESINVYSSTSSSEFSTITMNNLTNIPETGQIYNFAFIQIFINGILQNEPELNSYANFITQEEIANYDQETYGSYIQRSCSYITYSKYTLPSVTNHLFLRKSMSSIKQDASTESFYTNISLTLSLNYWSNPLSSHEVEKYGSQIKEQNKCLGWEIFDLLPKGMDVISNENDIINSFSTCFVDDRYPYCLYRYVDNKYEKIPAKEVKEFMKSKISVTITENWNNTERIMVYIKLDFTETPVYVYGGSYDHGYAAFQIKTKISYDSFLEHGSTYTNFGYAKFLNRNLGENGFTYNPYQSNKMISDDGTKDPIAKDINNNNNTSEKLMFAESSVSITSVVSTHQDVTTYVKTDQSNYSTGIVDTSCNSEYEYKLRVRTGSADITNLIIYTNIEEAQPKRTRWYGEFLGVDTTYAEEKGYNVKPYYSENPKAGNLYNEDGTLNSDWKECIPDTPEIVANGLSITFNNQSQTENNYDYVIIYYEKDGKVYQTQKLTGTNIAGKTVTIPSTDFYLYWYTDGSSYSYYGFSIDSIVPSLVENVTDTTGTVPSYTVTELQDNNYPDSAFDSYTHGNYGNDIRKLWHYTYTDSLVLQEFVQGIDKTKIKSLAFEYLDSEGNPAILPANSLTYVLIKMKSPADESIKTLARMDCRTQWNAIDEFGRPVDFITGINSNVVKVALPNSVKTDDMPSISLRFTKEINGTDSEFENMKLDKATQQTFMIRLTSLTANEDGSYNQVAALLRSDQELIISQIPVGTYLLEEIGDNYFNFIEFANNNDPEIIIEGVTFERTAQGYIITISEDLSETIEFNIKVTNEIEPERFYEDKDNKENLFLKNKIEENS